MSIEALKDILFIISIGIAIGGYIYSVKQIKSDIKQIKRTLYHENGGLNLINCQACKQHRDIVFTAIRRGEQKAEEQTKELRILNERILRIMIHLKIETQKDLV